MLQQSFQMNGETTAGQASFIVPTFRKLEPGMEARNADIDEIIKRFKSGMNVQDPTIQQVFEVYQQKIFVLQVSSL